MIAPERVFEYSSEAMSVAAPVSPPPLPAAPQPEIAPPARRPLAPFQRSFDDLGSALVDTTFVVFDLETTGGSPEGCAITEIGAVKVRAGEVLAEFHSLVNPLMPIPAAITMLTGITDEMVAGAEPIEYLLPAFSEFIAGSTLVAHNASFDTRFLAANLARHGYPAAENPVVCTVRLARRLVRDEVPNLQLQTLAHCLRARTVPSHRALDDARATTDVFHALLELAGRWGVTHLDDLLWFQSARGHPSYKKVRLVDGLPRARGVYLFRDDRDRVLYVGKATDLRARVRSYFGGDERKRIDDMLRELTKVDHVLCATDLEASVLEARLIRKHRPPYNRAQRGTQARWWLRLTPGPYPRISQARAEPGLGPFPTGTAVAVKEALEAASDIRTCTKPVGPKHRRAPCVRGQIGRCPAPCERDVPADEYAAVARPVADALGGDPTAIVEALAARLERFSDQQRYEEAASFREHVRAVIDAIGRARAATMLARAGRLCLAVGDAQVVLEHGTLVSAGGRALPVEPDGHPDEARLIAAWLSRNLRRIRLTACDGDLAEWVAGGRAIAEWRARLKAADVPSEGNRRKAG